MLDSLNEPLRFAKKKPRRKLRKPKLLEENIKQDDLKLSTEYVSPKKLKIKTSAIKKIEKTMTKINRKKRNISSKFDKILKSIEIDRPILLKDKIETLWRDKSKSKSYQSLRWQIEKKKYKRMQWNADLKQVYRLLLNYIKERNRQSEKLIPLDVEVGKLSSNLFRFSWLYQIDLRKWMGNWRKRSIWYAWNSWYMRLIWGPNILFLTIFYWFNEVW